MLGQELGDRDARVERVRRRARREPRAHRLAQLGEPRVRVDELAGGRQRRRARPSENRRGEARARGPGRGRTPRRRPRSNASRRARSRPRGGAGSSTVPPPTVVSVRRTTRSPRAATTALLEPELRVLAVANDARRHRVRPDVHGDRGGHRRELRQPDVEPVRRREVAGRDEHVAAREVAPLELGQVDRDALARVGVLDRRVVHLHRAHAHRASRRLDAQLVAGGDRARPERPGRDGADAAQREDAVDVAAASRRRHRARAPAARASAARSSSRPAPVFADTATTSAPGTSSRASSAASSSVSSSTASAFVSATTPCSTPSSRSTARCSSVCGRAPSCASITSRNRSMPVAPAIIVRTNRSCPGTSTSESRRPSGSSSGA